MENIKEIISNLKFISKLEVGDKIDTKNLYRMQPGYLSTIYRTISFDSRKSTLAFISKTVSNVFELLERLEKSNTDLYNSIITDLTSTYVGLNNLKETYNNDIKFQCDIDTLIQIIQSEINNKYKKRSTSKEEYTTTTSPMPSIALPSPMLKGNKEK